MSAEQVSPEVIKVTLRRLGWRSTGSFRNVVEYWSPEESTPETESSASSLVIPIDTTKSDFGLLMRRVTDSLKTLYGPEFETALNIAQAISSRQLDEIDFRKETTDTSGLIGWLAGNQIIESGRKLLMATAKAASNN